MQKQEIPTNMRTLFILEAVANSKKPLSATEINEQLNLPKQTIHRLIKKIVEEGFLQYDEGTRKLRPAQRARNLFFHSIEASSWSILRHQILQNFSEETGETVNYVVPTKKGMRYVDRVETAWSFRVQLPIGSEVPFHATASGKTFLAHIPKRRRDKYIDNINLKKVTGNTFYDKQEFVEELIKIKKQGYAKDNEEFMDNMVAYSVPIKNQEGSYIASLAVHGPKQRIMLQKSDFFINKLQIYAKKLEDSLK